MGLTPNSTLPLLQYYDFWSEVRLGRGVDIMAGPGLDTELEQLLGEEGISWGVMVQVSGGWWTAGHVTSILVSDWSS